MLLALISSQRIHAKNAHQARIDALVQPYLDSKAVMGLTVGILHKGKAATLGYGRLSEKNPRKPDGNTVYEIGSVSKVFTGLLLADAVTQGHVQLDQLATELLPEGVMMPTHEERPITLRHLATHTSGLPRLPDQFAPADINNPYADYSVKQLHGFLNRHQLTRAPGEKGEYSNLGMGLLGHLLALQAEQTYEKLLRARITKPLGMSSTSITLSKKQQSRLAPPHTVDGKLSTNWDLPTLAGAGAIRSTARDMLLFAKAHLSPPKKEIGKAIELGWKVHQKPLSQGDFAMGLAWHVAHDGSTRWHNGGTGGYHSMILISRKLDAAVVLLANTAAGEVDKLAQDILLGLAGTKVEPRRFEKAAKVAPEVMQRYVGKYQLAPGAIFTVSVTDDKLMVQLTGQQAMQVYARTETEWFYKGVDMWITFQVDAKGKCKSLELHRKGKQTFTAKRVGYRNSEKPLSISPDVMQRYVGKYQLTPNHIFTVTTKDNQLMVQLTGQQSLPVYARSETEWYYKVVDASITFQLDDQGKCRSLELFQGGVRQTAKRMK